MSHPITEFRQCQVCQHQGQGDTCASCGWPMSGRTLAAFAVERPYGHDVLVECAQRVRIEKRYKGCESTCRRRASTLRSFYRVLAMRPLTEQQYHQ